MDKLEEAAVSGTKINIVLLWDLKYTHSTALLAQLGELMQQMVEQGAVLIGFVAIPSHYHQGAFNSSLQPAQC